MGDSDEVVWNHALANLSVILSQDLDFSRMLALRGTELPSVIQLRVDAPIPEVCGADVLAVLRRYEAQLVEGCLISLQKDRHKVRLLPFR